MDKPNNFYNSNKKIRLKDTKVAYYWNLVLYILSAVTFADGLVGFTNQAWGEALNKDPVQKNKVISHLVLQEQKTKPWLSKVSALGWMMMFAGIGYELLR